MKTFLITTLLLLVLPASQVFSAQVEKMTVTRCDNVLQKDDSFALSVTTLSDGTIKKVVALFSPTGMIVNFNQMYPTNSFKVHDVDDTTYVEQALFQTENYILNLSFVYTSKGPFLSYKQLGNTNRKYDMEKTFDCRTI